MQRRDFLRFAAFSAVLGWFFPVTTRLPGGFLRSRRLPPGYRMWVDVRSYAKLLTPEA